MKIALQLLLSASVFCLISCSGSEDKNTAENTAVVPGTAAPFQAQPASNTNASGEVNPPHGAPNHRCDIAVGAPLDSPPQPSLNPVPQFAPPSQGGAVAPGTNPPHGQPGHDCSIAVGAPLNK